MRENSDVKTDASTKPTVTIPTSEIFTVYFSVRFIIFVNFIYIDVNAFLECFILQERPRARDHIPMLFIIISNSGRVRDTNSRILISDGAWNRGNVGFFSAVSFAVGSLSFTTFKKTDGSWNRAVRSLFLLSLEAKE